MKDTGKVLTCKKDFMKLLDISEYMFDQFYQAGLIKCQRNKGRYIGYSEVVLNHFKQAMEGDKQISE